jgi:tRNA pseudouridine38-40 synthase
MPLYALKLEYDGSAYAGWQRQASGLTLQELLETAAARLARGERVTSTVAGRTDAGVHAAAQVVGLEMPAAWEPARLREALNYHLKPHPVAVLEAAPAPPGWNARLSAIGRRYRYLILNRRARPALLAGRVWHVPEPLDLAAMAAGAALLVGRHDFTSFRAAACQAKSPLRTLDRLDIWREGELVVIEAEARSFLHHQVRNMVGTLAEVGRGVRPPADIARILAARDRRAAGPTAPAAGLCLMAVRYPPELDPFSRALPSGSPE